MSRHSVWKFQLQIIDRCTLEMPQGARVLCVQPQNNLPTLWALVDLAAPMVKRDFLIFGTGHPLDVALWSRPIYVGTVQTHGGNLVWHVFDIGEHT